MTGPVFALLICCAALAGCAGGPMPPAPAEPEPPGAARRAVDVVSNGWHTAIVVPRADAAGLLPEAGDFPGATFLEIGWGDRDYYQAPEATTGLALAAALTPTPAVLHVAPRGRAPPAGVEIIRVMLTEAGLGRLVTAIAGSFVRPKDGRAVPIGPGLAPGSRFYHARGTFHLFNTCNTWTARMLRAGGLAIEPSGIVTAGQLMDAVRDAVGTDPQASPWERVTL